MDRVVLGQDVTGRDLPAAPGLTQYQQPAPAGGLISQSKSLTLVLYPLQSRSPEALTGASNPEREMLWVM